MLWTHVYVLLFAVAAPCQLSDVDRFPPCVHQLGSHDAAADNDRPFPECPAIELRLEWLKANRALPYRDLGEWNDWDEQIREQEERERLWRLLWWARRYREMEYPSSVLERIWELREAIGEEAYAAGQMPSPIPVHRYREIPR